LFKVLVVDDEPQIREVFELILEANDSIEVFFAASGNLAIQLLQEQKDVGLIFCDYRMDDGSGGDVFKWVSENLPQTCFTLVSTYEPNRLEGFENFYSRPELYQYISKPFSAEKILKMVSDKSANSEKFSEYARIKLNTILTFRGKIKADVFVKIHEDKMVKIIDAHDDLDQDILQRYIDKSMHWGYVFHDKAQAMMKTKLGETDTLIQKIKTEIKFEDKGNLVLDALDNVREIIQTQGFNEAILKTADKSVIETLQFLDQTKGLKDLLSLFSKRGSYISNHGLLTAYFSNSLIQRLEWNTSELRKKIAIASLFQNISLQSEELAQIHSTIDDSFEECSLQDQKIVIEHPRLSSEILEAKEFFDSDVLNLILNHHESPYGNGFPRSIDSTLLSPIDGVIILSSHLAKEVLLNHSKELTVMVQDFNEIYNKGNFKKIYRALLQVLMRDIS